MSRDDSIFESAPETAQLVHDETPPEFERYTSDRRFFGHPAGLSTLFFTEMWERFSYYGIRPLLILFMTAALTSGGFGVDRQTAASLIGMCAACVELSAPPGGRVRARWLGLRRSIWYGGLFITAGYRSIALSAVFAQHVFFIGL